MSPSNECGRTSVGVIEREGRERSRRWVQLWQKWVRRWKQGSLPSCLPPPPPPPPPSPPPSLPPFLCLSLLLCGDLVIVYFLSCLAGSFCLINEQHLNRTKRAEEIAFNCKKVSLTFPSLHPHSLIFIWVFFFYLFLFFLPLLRWHFEQGRWQCLVMPLRQRKQS